MDAVNWSDLLARLEAEFAVSRREKMLARNFLARVAAALSQAEETSADTAVIDRLDMMLMQITEAGKENVCTNTKCPHYNKKCKMR